METYRDFDPSALERVRALGGPALVKRLVSLVLESTPKRVNEARDSVLRGDLAGAAFAAHALRSSAGNTGATVVFALAGDLEAEARAGHRDTVATLTGLLADAAAAMQVRLLQLVDVAA